MKHKKEGFSRIRKNGLTRFSKMKVELSEPVANSPFFLFYAFFLIKILVFPKAILQTRTNAVGLQHSKVYHLEPSLHP